MIFAAIATIFHVLLALIVTDIVLLIAVGKPRYNAPAWLRLVPGAILFAVLFRRDLLR